MSSISEPIAPQNEAPAPAASADRIDDRLGELNSLLDHWQQVGAKKQANLSATDQAFENCLVQVRLGMASSLFMALRVQTCADSQPFAPRCAGLLRVGHRTGHVRRKTRDAIEVAACCTTSARSASPIACCSSPGAADAEEAC